MKYRREFLLTLAIMSLASCSKMDSSNFQIVDTNNGQVRLIDGSNNRLLIVDRNNRINDVVDLNLKEDEIQKIREIKSKQDSALKVKYWGKIPITGTSYSVSLSTRYYKDKLLYIFNFSPSDAASQFKARATSINLRDENGFILEKIDPHDLWVSIVDNDGKKIYEQASGEVSMTLENYLEIKSFDPIWSF